MAENPTFHLFSLLPVELQDEIWSWAVPSAIETVASHPEVCIAAPVALLASEVHFSPSLPLTVDTAWPSLAHACRNSRGHLFRSRYFTLRQHVPSQLVSCRRKNNEDANENKEKQMLVPFRLFNHSIDTLYWSNYQHYGMTRSFLTNNSAAADAPLAASLRNLAIEMGAAEMATVDLGDIFVFHAPLVRNITLVLPSGTLRAGGVVGNFWRDIFCGIPPVKRCRIRILTPGERAEIKLMTNADPRKKNGVAKLEDYVFAWKRDLDKSIAEEAAGCMWDVSKGGKVPFGGLEVHVGVFEEWAATGTVAERRQQQQQWVEPAAMDPDDYNRLRVIPDEERRDPLKYRPLDDEVMERRGADDGSTALPV